MEYQVRTVFACGARHIVVMVDQVPAALVAAFDRLRDEGIAIDIARDARDAADRIHPDEDVVVVASGVVASRERIAALAASIAPTLLTWPDEPPFANHERIDGQDRWSGLALLKGEHLRQTAAMIGDWTLGPTLLRYAVQQHVARTRLAADDLVAIVRDEGQARAVSEGLARSYGEPGQGPFARLAAAPLATLAVGPAMAKPLPFDLILVFAPALFAAAILLAWAEWPAVGFASFLLGLVAGKVAERYAAAGVRESAMLRWQRRLEIAVFAVLALFMAGLAWRTGAGWGINILAVWLVSGTVLAMPRNAWSPAAGDLGAILMFASGFGEPVLGLALCVAWQVAAQAFAGGRFKGLVTP